MDHEDIKSFEEQFEEFLQPFRDITTCAYKSYNWLKAGLHEDAYEVGLKIELEQLGYDVGQQEDFLMWYKGQPTTKKFRLDLFVRSTAVGNIILELKALQSVGEKELRQLHSYMRLTNTRYGMLINFGQRKVYAEIWKYDNTANNFERLRY